ncbi:MAG: DUF5060 domain-containing protein [Spirochaetaceae bacterium]|nr:MAG: DUF5060 domain-containing protein [Spirochaetaceae bacterium]
MSTTFTPSAPSVPTYDRFEVEVHPAQPLPANPFTDARLRATVTTPVGQTWRVEGFCDSDDGSLYRLRVMPTDPGEYRVDLRFERGATAGGRPLAAVAPETSTLLFTATASKHPGVVRLDPEHREHFVFSGSGEHYYWNGTTAYYLMGYTDESVIDASLARLARKRVNRARVMLYGRQYDRPWGQPVVQSDAFSMCLNPWPARFPDDPTLPEFDLTRFNVEYWRKYERMLAAADRHGVQISVCFFIGAQQLAVPFAMWSEDEVRYYRYAIARLAAFANVTWDIGNEHDFHRDNRFWVMAIGSELTRHDPYRHLCGVHNKPYYDRAGGSLTLQLHQKWDAGLSRELDAMRRSQRDAGHELPQIIEEFGYEELWEQFPGHRSAETRRRVCWEIAMAGCYQTNGETARTGTGVAPDTGGGWVTGRGDETMAMFDRVAPMVDFFTSFEWWRATPDSAAIVDYEPGTADGVEYYYGDGRPATDLSAQALVGPDSCVVYLPYGGRARVKLPARSGGARDGAAWSAISFDPRTGARTVLAPVESSTWMTPWTDGPADAVYLLERQGIAQKI